MTHAKIGRNDKCHCGSGKKFKQCCEAKTQPGGASRFLILALAGILVVVIFAIVSAARHGSTTPASGKVWSAEHGHYH
jgi:hypothetical protein